MLRFEDLNRGHSGTTIGTGEITIWFSPDSNGSTLSLHRTDKYAFVFSDIVVMM